MPIVLLLRQERRIFKTIFQKESLKTLALATYLVLDKFLSLRARSTFFQLICKVFKPPKGVPSERCSENMQQIYRRTPMSQCDFNKVPKQLCWNQTSAWVFSCKFAVYFQNTFYQVHLRVAACGVKTIFSVKFVNKLKERTALWDQIWPRYGPDTIFIAIQNNSPLKTARKEYLKFF